MRARPLGTRLTWCLVAMLVAIPLFGAEPGPAEREVLQADTDRIDAMVKGDAAALDALLAPELSYVTSRAMVEDKQSLIYGIRSRQMTFKRIISTERKACVTGSMALVTGVSAMKGIDGRQNFEISTRFTAVYTRRDGRWQLVAFHETQLLPGGRVIGGESA